MTQLTQEDLEYVFINLLGAKRIEDRFVSFGKFAPALTIGQRHWFIGHLPNIYTDDSFTGALVKVVFPLLTEKELLIEILPKGTIQIRNPDFYDSYEIFHYGDVFLIADNLNTALIEAWKKIEGEKK